MKAKPKTTYRLVSPDSWRLIRAAYLSGLSAPTVAARFDISVAALRKRAAREGWTKRDILALSPLKVQQVHDLVESTQSAAGEVAHVQPLRAIQDQIVENVYAAVAVAMPRAAPTPAALSRKALLHAAHAMAQDRPRDALAHARAAEMIARLDRVIPDVEPVEDDENVDWRMREMRKFIWQTAAVMADHMANGGEAPMGFKEEIAAWKAERAREDDARAGRGGR
jgi:hypothetical protein